ncbi:MAG: type II toxin-antitoxin system VapC family toxin, partial [Planctomycetaceae bacterium]|nr:type II toxin-antitoxin system VapC family toxin [Planctomycetaceae bacterium]
MNYLLDTHIAIWALGEDKRLSKSIARIFADEECKKYISIASVWEMAIKIRLGKLNFPNGTVGFVQALYRNGIELLPIQL